MTNADPDPTDADRSRGATGTDQVPDPADTDHPAGDDHAAENAENEPPG